MPDRPAYNVGCSVSVRVVNVSELVDLAVGLGITLPPADTECVCVFIGCPETVGDQTPMTKRATVI